MTGFENRFTDIVDDIVLITEEIAVTARAWRE